MTFNLFENYFCSITIRKCTLIDRWKKNEDSIGSEKQSKAISEKLSEKLETKKSGYFALKIICNLIISIVNVHSAVPLELTWIIKLHPIQINYKYN